MKKYLLLLTSAALLLAGCAKELVSNGVSSRDGELTKVTFTASLDNGVATKAVADGDGAAANVNRCIMEIYYGDALFTRQITKVTDKKATFPVQVVSNRTYKVAFWADKVDNADTPEGLAADEYYNTASLKEIAINGAYSGNDDARDAFFHTGTYTVAQAGSSWGDIKLKRPFAQMNVITTDWDKAASVTGLAPEKVNVTLKNALVNFNAVTGEASGSQTLTYEAAVYTAPDPVDPVSTIEKTLSMDYLFASDTKALIDIDWKALHGEDTPVAHSFAAAPYQRNYRTNIKGALLTTQGQWTVTVDPDWELDPNGDFDYAYTSVYDIQGANDFVAKNKGKKEISVTFSTQPSDAGDPSLGTDEHPINAIVTSLLKQGATYNIDVASTTDVLYVGDYKYNTTESGTTYDYTVVLQETNAAAVNLVVSDNLYIGTLVVNSPSKSVSINGQTVQSGKTYHIENLQVQEVSMNTVIIEKGMVVENLEMIKGGLEIHGTVHKAIVPANTPIEDIAVRDCENLDEELVYNVLKNYIAEDYVGVKGRTTAGKWDIIPVAIPVTSVSLNLDKVALNVGKDTSLTATVLPEDASNKSVVWTSSNIAVATVDQAGKVTAVAAGSAEITVTTVNKSKTATCSVTVIPAGAIGGEFSVSANKKVYFSQGNLWYGPVTEGAPATFNFEANQYSGTSYANNHVSHFFWSKTASVAYAQTYSDSGDGTDVFFTNKEGFKVSVDGKEQTGWRTLSRDEWCYLFAYDPVNHRFITTTPRYNLYNYGVTVCGKPNCVVLLPDEWDTDVISLENFASTSNYSEETSPKWSTMEAAGAVCLPAAGRRSGSNVSYVGSNGWYWSSIAYTSDYAYYVDFDSHDVDPDDPHDRSYSYSVRLITECQ